ncbi:HSP90 family protein [Fredinandcohnia quinoae]|uniref:HSP90 family protein n=1 Tax=Fredinandcohnia quinoae TaxID=2918902 RepID=A0AAW5E447_9BACI|nr:HSP90 family protein [Fredinandcohnia sp. SECRCQ15]MCH1624101.1 HSP90 family protein [Fredinandcohnia sp. SECRCQ15]
MSENLRFQVHLTGMIDILSNHLYNEKDVYIRELLQNANDAITARKRLHQDFTPRIYVSLTESTESSPTIIFEDNGVGLTENEVHQFLATIANSSKGEKTFGDSGTDFIGRFGIGLLSCFIVSEEIVMVTTSAKTFETIEWRGKSDGTYLIRKLDEVQLEPGTQVFIRKKKADDLPGDCFNQKTLRQTLKKYGSSLEPSITLAHLGVEEELNHWSKQFAEHTKLHQMSRSEVLKLGLDILGMDYQDYFLIENETGRTFGIAYIVPHTIHMNAKKTNAVFLNRMFVTKDCQSILPDWALFIHCILWTDELSPVASREDFFKNEALELVSESLGNAIKKNIITLPDVTLTKLMHIHYLNFKALASQDEEFLSFIYPYLPMRTLDGEQSLQTIFKNHKVIYYTETVDAFRQIQDIARAKQMMLVNGGYTYDVFILNKLENLLPEQHLQFINPLEMTATLQKLDTDEELTFSNILKEMNLQMDRYKVNIEIRRFEPIHLPTLFIHSNQSQEDRELERIAEASNSLFNQLLMSLQPEEPERPILYLNLSNHLTQRILTSGKTAEQLAVIIQTLYIQALLLGHYPLKQNELEMMNRNLLYMLELI